jgi:adenylate kinase family enzyme
LTHAAASDDIPKQIEAAIASAPKGKKPRVILEGFPTTIEQSDRFERDVSSALRTFRKLSAQSPRDQSRLSHCGNVRMVTQVCPILVVLFIDLEAKQALARLEQRDKSIQNDARINWKRFEDKSRAIVKRFRDEGNILEVRRVALCSRTSQAGWPELD